jgi:hypothetical protein
MIELISVHVPKCAGTSLLSALVGAYGAAAVYIDNEDAPGHPTSPVNLDPVGYFAGFGRSGYPFLAGKSVVHGHVHIGKYDCLPDRCLRATFLRHPVARAISHFRYWQQHPRRSHPLHHYMLDNQLDILRFAGLPLIRYFYSRTFFGGVDRSRFDFIGCVETLEPDLSRLGQMIGRPLEFLVENVTADGTDRVEDPEVLR